jgi:hypothetical protein
MAGVAVGIQSMLQHTLHQQCCAMKMPLFDVGDIYIGQLGRSYNTRQPIPSMLPVHVLVAGCPVQKLRFEMGDLYTVSVGNFFGCDAPSSTAPQLRGDVSIAFTCDPANKVGGRQQCFVCAAGGGGAFFGRGR